MQFYVHPYSKLFIGPTKRACVNKAMQSVSSSVSFLRPCDLLVAQSAFIAYAADVNGSRKTRELWKMKVGSRKDGLIGW